MLKKAYPVSVVRGKYDCTNNGVSSKVDDFLVVTDEAYGEELAKVQPAMGRPILVLEQHVACAVRVRPLKSAYSKGCGPMFGSNYVKGDSSFGEAVAALLGTKVRMYDPVSIHDRFESQELNDMMSR